MKIVFVFGTRPEAIKLAPLIREMQGRQIFQLRVAVTAQHREMLDQVLEAFCITPDYDLGVMQPGQDLFDITTRCLTSLREVLRAELPDWTVVQGDTTTTFTAALAAFYLGLKVAHVEAGLRTGDKRRPFPEEVNRRLTSHLTELHFAPTERARQCLLAEGVAPERVHVTGNTVVDALLHVRDRFQGHWPEVPELRPAEPGLRRILVTGHRRENFGAGFERICRALQIIAARPDVEIVYPVHLNPQVQEPVHRMLDGYSNVQLISPLPYVPFVGLMESSHLILTDSGGIQEEAPSLGRPVLVMREVTERPEGLEAGTARLVGTGVDSIVGSVNEVLDSPTVYTQMARLCSPYGNGGAAIRIADILAGTPG